MTEIHPPNELPRIAIGDPLYRFVTERLDLRLRHVMAALLVINLIRTVVIPYYHHLSVGSNLFANANITDIQLWLISFVSQPIVLYVYWTLVNLIPRTFELMQINGVVTARKGKTVAQFLVDLERRMTSRRYTYLIGVVSVIGVILFQALGWSTARFRGDYGSYPYNDFQQYVIESAFGLFRITLVGWAAVRLLLYIDAINDWWGDFEAEVKPLHPDKAGGFSAIGDLTLHTGLLVGALGLFLAANILAEAQRSALVQLTTLLMLLVVMIVLIPFAFITPIWSTHQAMQEARLRQLRVISERFEKLWDSITSGKTTPGKEEMEQLSSLEKLRDMTLDVIPVWPFAWEDLRRFGIALTPLWTVTITFLIQAILSGLFSRLFGIGQ